MRLCTDCDIVTSGNVKHCKLCERCVVHMDHHCLFLLICVATLNHLRFVVFIILVPACILAFLLSSCNLFSHVYSDLTYREWVWLVLDQHTLLTSVMILNIASLFWGLSLISWNLKYISMGLTFYETLHNEPSKQASLTLRDRTLNVIRFFQGHKTPHRSLYTV